MSTLGLNGKDDKENFNGESYFAKYGFGVVAGIIVASGVAFLGDYGQIPFLTYFAPVFGLLIFFAVNFAVKAENKERHNNR